MVSSHENLLVDWSFWKVNEGFLVADEN